MKYGSVSQEKVIAEFKRRGYSEEEIKDSLDRLRRYNLIEIVQGEGQQKGPLPPKRQ